MCSTSAGDFGNERGFLSLEQMGFGGKDPLVQVKETIIFVNNVEVFECLCKIKRVLNIIELKVKIMVNVSNARVTVTSEFIHSSVLFNS